jgi:phosphomannomutase/phosphoglucomutase
LPVSFKFHLVPASSNDFNHQVFAVLYPSGARISFPGDATGAVGAPPKWGLVRASNTGPVLVMRFEAGTKDELDAIRKEVESVVTAERSKLGG